MDIKTLSERIQQKADDELKAELEQLFIPVESKLNNGEGWAFTLPEASNDKGQCHWRSITRGLKDQAFEQLKEKNRQNAIDGFMGRVHELQGQLDNLTHGLL